jgi:hypothetical protein
LLNSYFVYPVECPVALGEEIKEWHQHTYGPVGIFMFDLRGNRIDGNGVQVFNNLNISLVSLGGITNTIKAKNYIEYSK